MARSARYAASAIECVTKSTVIPCASQSERSLSSSLWRVSDISTAMLMKQFYREYQTRSKAESLRRAMLHVKDRFPHPGYWGAFTLTGDYK